MSKTIQRQSILSTIIIFAGFGFGALNLIVLQKWVLTREEWGLTRVITDAAILMASFATLGAPNVVAKFMPFYKRYLPPQKNDLTSLASAISGIGLATTVTLLFVLQTPIIKIFGKNNQLFETHYYALPLFVLFQTTFIFMEVHAWYAGKTVLTNFLKELLFRALTTLLLLLYAYKFITFDRFIQLFSCIYLPAVMIIIWEVRKAGGLRFAPKISTLTRRLKYKMLSLGLFVFSSSFSSVAFAVCDTLFLAGIYNFSQAGIYAVAQYFSQVLEVPMRSIQAASVPLLAEYWREKNMTGLASIYRKSCMNLLIAGLGLGGLMLVNMHNIEKYFGPEYSIMITPLIILIIGRWINLGTGLNTVIIQLSTFWRFDFISTLIYTLIGVPLNFLLIKNYGMIGAAIANLVATTLYNATRFIFLWKKYKLQPFSLKNAWLLLGSLLLTALILWIPTLHNLYLDSLLRSSLFILLFGALVIKAKFSEEVNGLWKKWWGKILHL